jgi:2-polyprenyl-3-methyl-5-hydroxy-6-metoxy-1,4-benzoquinol methylase
MGSMDRREYAHISFQMGETQYHRVIARLVLAHTPPDGSVLDLGCGLGHILALVHQAAPGIALTAADPSPRCLETTRQRVPSVKTVSVREDVLEVEKLGSGYDTCVMSHSLEHMLSPIDAIRKVLGMLRPGGHLVLAVPNPARPTVLMGNLWKQHYVNRGHVYAWDRSHWINFLERILGLDVVEYASDEVRIFSHRITGRLRFLQKLEIALARVAPWWSFSNIAVVRNTPGRELPAALRGS